MKCNILIKSSYNKEKTTIMIDNLLECIVDNNNNSKRKKQALVELREILEKLEVGIEAVSREDADWSYASQKEEIKTDLENVNLEIEINT